MTSHIHMIIGSDGKMNLDKIVGERKSYTSTRFKTLIKENAQESPLLAQASACAVYEKRV